MVSILLGSVQTAQVLGGHRSRRARFALFNRPCCEPVVETRVNPPGHARCGMGSAGIPSAINTPCSSSSLHCAAMQPLGDLHCLYPYRWEVGPSHMPGALPRCPEARDMSFFEGDILGGLMTLSCM